MSRRKQKFISLRPCFQVSECIRGVPPHFLMHVDWGSFAGVTGVQSLKVTRPQHQAAHNALQTKRSDWSSQTALDAEWGAGWPLPWPFSDSKVQEMYTFQPPAWNNAVAWALGPSCLALWHFTRILTSMQLLWWMWNSLVRLMTDVVFPQLLAVVHFLGFY